MAFNLDDYQTVAERLDQAIKDHPDIRVITSLEHIERVQGKPVHVIFKAEIWFGTTLVSTGWADEVVGSSPVNRAFAIPNAETSSLGRALANLGYQGKNPKETRPSREEMTKVVQQQREEVKLAKPLDWGEPELPPEPPADDPFASWDPVAALGAEVIETKPIKRNDQVGNAGAPCTEKQQKMIRAIFAEKHPDGDLAAFITEVVGKQFAHLSDLDKWQASMVIDRLKG